MRKEFIRFLVHQAEIDPTCYLLVGDVGFSVIEPFAEKFPDRYINAGIAEQNMVGMAAGLAMAGKRVYVYSIVPFACMRPFEQIRDDICYQQLPVTIVGNGGGYSYGQAGVTHHAIEDVAIMRALPEMLVVAPGSVYEVEQLMPQIHSCTQPMYLRFGACENKINYANSPVFLGKAIELIPHDRNFLIASGNSLDYAWDACMKLNEMGLSIGLVSMPTIKPLDVHFFMSKKDLSFVATVEEHSVIGGLGEAVARCLLESVPQRVQFKTFGINDFYNHEVGARAYLNKKSGLTADNIVQQLQPLLGSSQLTAPTFGVANQ